MKIEETNDESNRYNSTHPEIQSILFENPPLKIKNILQNTNRSHSFFQNIHLWQYNDLGESQEVLDQLQKVESVIYAEPNRAFKINHIPNDFYYFEQWYLPTIKMPDAWEIEKGNDSIIVGVIDTGIDYNHEDLQGQLWINQTEDLNQNGKLDSIDINGIDEDNNGYSDDVIGWDFTDAPNFPDHGDYLEPDNDPMDEYLTGHGTPVTGIINAQQNNQIGISGIASNVKVMALRAGTASGFLEEDDVAEAIIYGVDNGCKIINMSFGDNVFSYLIHDAVIYGRNNGVLFVASSGNDGNSILQYPAAYDETVSVGATNSSNALAGFSSYGNKLNLVAPGEEIFSCQINNSYGLMSGTSFSAPIVSAVAALILSKHPNYSLETLKGALFSGCKDLGFNGWDIYYGHGLVDAYKSLSISNQGFAEILSPSLNDGIAADQVAVIGTAFSPNLISFSLKYGVGENPNSWDVIRDVVGSQTIKDTLAIWNTIGLADTVYTLELRLKQFNYQDIVYRTQVYIDHTAPILSNLTAIEMQIGPENGVLFEFETDDLTRATLYYGESGSNNLNQTKTSPYFRNQHYFILSQSDISGLVDYYIHIENSSHLVNIIDNNGQFFQLSIADAQPVENIFSFKEQFNFSGYFLPLLTDFNSNQMPELVISEKLDSIQYGQLQIWELANQQWVLKSETNFNAIPRDVGDINNDGAKELLAGFGSTSMILEIGEGAQFPNKITWIDTSNIWGSRIVNLDSDSTLELLAIKNNVWSIFDLSIPGYQPIFKQQLHNTTPGENSYGIPWSIVTDLDEDGLQEIVVGDYDGDILIFEDNGSEFYQLIWTKKLSGTDATHLFQSLDLNGDGKNELVTVVRNEPENPTESNSISKYWYMTVWQAVSNNQFEQVFEERFHGINSQRSALNGLSVLDFNEDGLDEIVFSPFPRVYQIQYSIGNYQIGWYHEGVNTNSILQYDFDNNGQNDILLNTDSGIQRFESELNTNRPLPPIGFKGIPLDTNIISLNWRNIPNANYYKIYRKQSQGNLGVLDSTQNNFIVDSTVSSNQIYSYAVTQVNYAFPEPESQYSEIISIQPNTPPSLDTLIVLSSRQILLQFDEQMSNQTFSTNNFGILPQKNTPVSAIRGKNKQNVILSFKNEFYVGQNYLLAYNLTDQQGTPIKLDTLQYGFVFNPLQRSFYLQKVEFRTKNHLKLIFSNPVNNQTASQKANYSLEPDGEVISAEIDTLELNVVHIFIKKNNRMGSLGVPYYIHVHNIRDTFGNLLNDNFENRLLIIESVKNIDNVLVYPNPYNPQVVKQPLRFANVPFGSEVFIFNTKGQFIRKLKEENYDGGVVWDLKTEGNNSVGSGVYLYIVRYEANEIKGKFVIIK